MGCNIDIGDTDFILWYLEYGTNVPQSTTGVAEEDSPPGYVCVTVKHSPELRPYLTKTVKNSLGQ